MERMAMIVQVGILPATERANFHLCERLQRHYMSPCQDFLCSLATSGGGSESKKRKREDLETILDSQAQQIERLQRTSVDMLEQLRYLKQVLSDALVAMGADDVKVTEMPAESS
mmetsp:Transcript_22209/g.62005  ORF Transcript_22209/g.62005 Transcript_22209/m.62005 type:complete len:114 (-) Transcript_22209:849-1190(-)